MLVGTEITSDCFTSNGVYFYVQTNELVLITAAMTTQKN